jgi:hypothetical protein
MTKAKAKAKAKVKEPWEMPYARVRIRHPSMPGYYYDGNHTTWVTRRYTTWTIAEWKRKFQKKYKQDTLQWEFYGEMIYENPPGQDYSDE